jgi:glycosyltransferase involved in cell wall biosynthesis
MAYEPIKLVHITTVPQSLGFMTGQVAYLKRRGFDVRAVSSPGDLLGRFGCREQVEVHAVDMPRRITPVQDLVALFRIWKVLRKIRPHIVHAHTPKGGVLGMAGAWLAGVPVRIYHMRGLPFMTATGWKRALLMSSERVSCTLSHRILCISGSMRRAAIDLALCRPNKIVVLGHGSGNGVDAAQRFNDASVTPAERAAVRRRWNIPPGALVLGFIGRIVRDKGIAELAAAWSELRDEFPHLHLVLIGPHEKQDPISEEVDRALRDDPRVHLLGEQNDTPPLYAIMDVLALPSHREGFGNVLLEAAGMKVPVVATRITGCLDAVQDGVTGLLVPPHDAAGLAGAVRRYLQDGSLRARHGAAGRERALRDFRPEGIWQATHREYLECLRINGVKPQSEAWAVTAGEPAGERSKAV